MSIEKWVNELQCEIDKLKRIVIDGGGFDPTQYTYITPFIDVSSTPTQIKYSESTVFYYEATADCVVIGHFTRQNSVGSLLVQISDGNESYTIGSYNDDDVHFITLPLKAGQSIGASNITYDTTLTALYVFPVLREQLTPRTTIIDRAIAAVKKVTKKRAKTTKGKE